MKKTRKLKELDQGRDKKVEQRLKVIKSAVSHDYSTAHISSSSCPHKIINQGELAFIALNQWSGFVTSNSVPPTIILRGYDTTDR